MSKTAMIIFMLILGYWVWISFREPMGNAYSRLRDWVGFSHGFDDEPLSTGDGGYIDL